MRDFAAAIKKKQLEFEKQFRRTAKLSEELGQLRMAKAQAQYEERIKKAYDKSVQETD